MNMPKLQYIMVRLIEFGTNDVRDTSWPDDQPAVSASISDVISDMLSIVLKQVVQDSCRLLALQDVSLLSSSVSKLVKAVQMLPRLERFVNR